MKRALLFAICLFLYYFLTTILFVFLVRVPNFNLVLLIIFSLIFFLLANKAIGAESPGRRLVYGAFAGLVLWSIIGEICPSARAHPASIYNPIVAINIKQPHAAVYFLLFLITLLISYFRGAVKDGLAMMLMVLGSIWAFELYLQNYSTRVPTEALQTIAYSLGGICGIILLVAITMVLRSRSTSGKIFWGYWLYWGIVYTLVCFLVLPHPMPMGFW